jgi:hypothetical protein
VDDSAVKVLFQEDENVETLWAERVGPDQYRLDNSPFWAYGVSWKDVVEAHPDAEGMLRFARVVVKSGHRTIRVVLPRRADESSASQAILDGLNELGATYEGMHAGYVSVDMSPDADFHAVVKYLIASGQQWEYADPPYSALFPDAAV